MICLRDHLKIFLYCREVVEGVIIKLLIRLIKSIFIALKALHFKHASPYLRQKFLNILFDLFYDIFYETHFSKLHFFKEEIL